MSNTTGYVLMIIIPDVITTVSTVRISVRSITSDEPMSIVPYFSWALLGSASCHVPGPGMYRRRPESSVFVGGSEHSGYCLCIYICMWVGWVVVYLMFVGVCRYMDVHSLFFGGRSGCMSAYVGGCMYVVFGNNQIINK